MATHSSILGWRIPWTQEPGGLQSMGSQRVRHDWVTNTHTHTHTHVCVNPNLLIYLIPFGNHNCVFYTLSLFLLGNKLICIFFLDSTYKLFHMIFVFLFLAYFIWYDNLLCCFRVLAIVNSAVMNVGVHVCFRAMFLSRYMTRTGFAGSYGGSPFSFLRNFHTALIVAVPVYIPINSVGGYLFSIPFPTLFVHLW